MKLYYQYTFGRVSAETIQEMLNSISNIKNKALSWQVICQVYINNLKMQKEYDFLNYDKTYFSFYFENNKPVLDRILTAQDFEKLQIL